LSLVVEWEWHNIPTKGNGPSPRFGAKICILGNKLWLVGGSSAYDYRCSDLYTFDFRMIVFIPLSLHKRNALQKSQCYYFIFMMSVSLNLESETWENLTKKLRPPLVASESVGMICPYFHTLFIFMKFRTCYIIDTRAYTLSNKFSLLNNLTLFLLWWVKLFFFISKNVRDYVFVEEECLIDVNLETWKCETITYPPSPNTQYTHFQTMTYSPTTAFLFPGTNINAYFHSLLTFDFGLRSLFLFLFSLSSVRLVCVFFSKNEFDFNT
jgi:hypothetical protein